MKNRPLFWLPTRWPICSNSRVPFVSHFCKKSCPHTVTNCFRMGTLFYLQTLVFIAFLATKPLFTRKIEKSARRDSNPRTKTAKALCLLHFWVCRVPFVSHFQQKKRSAVKQHSSLRKEPHWIRIHYLSSALISRCTSAGSYPASRSRCSLVAPVPQPPKSRSLMIERATSSAVAFRTVPEDTIMVG